MENHSTSHGLLSLLILELLGLELDSEPLLAVERLLLLLSLLRLLVLLWLLVLSVEDVELDVRSLTLDADRLLLLLLLLLLISICTPLVLLLDSALDIVLDQALLVAGSPSGPSIPRRPQPPTSVKRHQSPPLSSHYPPTLPAAV